MFDFSLFALRAFGASLVLAAGLLALRRARGAVRHAAFGAALGLTLLAPLFGSARLDRTIQTPQEVKAWNARMERWSKRKPPLVEKSPYADAMTALSNPPQPLGLHPWLVFLPGAFVLGRYALGRARVGAWARRAGKGRVRYSDRAPVPLTFGAFRSVVLLPEAAREWPESRREAAIAHELAHVARRDALWQGLARLGVAALWWNPLAWWMDREMRAAAEEAADDLAARGDRPGYARSLVEIARHAGRTPVAALPMVDRGGVARRVAALLSPSPRRTPVWALAALPLGGLSPLVLPRQMQIRQPIWWSDEAVVEYVAAVENGRTVAWRPDGTPLTPAEIAALPVRPPKPVRKNEIMFVVRWNDPTGVAEGAIGSTTAVTQHDGPRYAVYGRSSFTTSVGRPGPRRTAGFVAFPKGFDSLRGPLSYRYDFALYAGPLASITAYEGAPRSVKDITGRTIPNPLIPIRETVLAPAEGGWSKGWTLGFRLQTKFDTLRQGSLWNVVVAERKDGRVETNSIVQDEDTKGEIARVSFDSPLTAYRRVRLMQGVGVSKNFFDVALRPR